MQLGRALGFVPSSERRRSGKACSGLGRTPKRKNQGQREVLEAERDHALTLKERYGGLQERQQQKIDEVTRKLRDLPDDLGIDERRIIEEGPLIDEIELTEEQKAKNTQAAEEFVDALGQGDGIDPALESANETLMCGSVVSTDEDQVFLPVELPEDVRDENVVKTLTETRIRHDFSLAVTRLELEVEKKVVVTSDGERKVISASTFEFGPPRYSVTWRALATLAIMVVQFAMPLNRLATMLSTSAKRFTSGGLSRMLHYVASRFSPIYLELAKELADSAVMAGDDTTCRVLEVSSYFSSQAKKGEAKPPPWMAYRTTEEANASYASSLALREQVLKQRAEGDRAAKRMPLMEPSLSVIVGKELRFESPRRDGKGAKRALNTTVLMGRSFADDPRSTIVLYRSHLGSLGDFVEMVLRHREPSARELLLQTDLSTTNLVTDPKLCSQFDIHLAGCGAHARRPFALYEDHDPLHAPYMLHLFKGVAMNEELLDRYGRNPENVLAVRADSRRLWERIKELAEKMLKKWSRPTPLGQAVRYIIKHFGKLTAYLDDPRLDATNNLRERLLRLEKLIEKSALFRRSIEGRVVLDILRTILQTAIAADVDLAEYLIDVMKTDADLIAKNPERYTPRAWAARRAKPQQ